MLSMLSDAYLRKSTADAGKSVTRQERDWRADCLTSGDEPGRVFVDPELSASRYARHDRPSYAELVEHIRSGRCRLLALWETSRGARNMAEWVTLLDLCRQHGVLIRIFGGGDPATFDPRKQRDRASLLRDGIDAETESETLSNRVRDGVRDSVRQGKPPGPMLFGYVRRYNSRGKFEAQEVDPANAAILRRLAKDTLAGRSLSSQARELNAAGIPSPKGGTWRGGHIARMLRNPGIAPGFADGKFAQRINMGQVVGDAVWPPILTYEEHRALRRLLEAPGRRASVDSQLIHYLSGAVACGKCGSPLRTIQSRRVHTVCYSYGCVAAGCRGVAALITPMEKEIRNIVCDRLREPDASAIFAPQVSSAELDAAQRELEDLEDYLDGYVEQAADPKLKLSPATLAAVEAKVRPQIEAAGRRVRQLSTPPALAAYVDVDVPAIWDSLPAPVRRGFVVALAELTLAPIGRSRGWSVWRLAPSRWIGAQETWGATWEREGVAR